MTSSMHYKMQTNTKLRRHSHKRIKDVYALHGITIMKNLGASIQEDIIKMYFWIPYLCNRTEKKNHITFQVEIG